jgi:methionyl aminopeptidase
MLSEKELNTLRKNAKVHKAIFDAIKKTVKPGTTAREIDDLAGKMCYDSGVLPAFLGVYDYPNNLQTSVNDVVVHGLPRDNIVFQEGDVVTFDFGVKDKKHGIHTDAAFTMIVGDGPHDPKVQDFLEVNKEALRL